MTDKNLRDIASIQELLQKTQGMVDLKQIAETLKPFDDLFQRFGFDINKFTDAISSAEEYRQKAHELAQIPDKFNDHFVESGWIIYGNMKSDVIQQAIELADTGAKEEAEQLLVNYYTPATVHFWLTQMNRIKAFKPRMRLAQLAFKDYEDGRYHACTPVILALMDGLVNELNGKQGFFAKDTELTAWDSLAAHEKGLVQLGRIFGKGRDKTRTEVIMIPYRNGIMHGNDLGYDNQTVAAKTWAALFAVAEWAEKAEKDQLKQPPPEPQQGFSEVLDRIKQNKALNQQISEWKPRILQVGTDFPLQGTIKNYAENSPEQKLVEFLSLWKTKNYGFMAKCVQLSYKIPPNLMPKKVKEVYQIKELIDFEIKGIEDKAPSLTKVFALLKYHQYGHLVEKEYEFRMLYNYENDIENPEDKKQFSWTISNWVFY